jgi:hypothetical protein
MLIGLYVFALSVIIDFFNTQQRTALAEAKNEALEKLAYEDIMTGVFNRLKMNELAEQLIQSRKKFGIVNFDLNDLKKAKEERIFRKVYNRADGKMYENKIEVKGGKP